MFLNEDFSDRFLAYNNNFVGESYLNKVAEAMKGIIGVRIFVFYYMFGLHVIFIFIVLEEHWACCHRDPAPLLQPLQKELDVIKKECWDVFYFKLCTKRYLTKYHDDDGA